MPTPAPDCGDGVLNVGEQCDFGDNIDGDGCSSLCRFELVIPGGGGTNTDCISEIAVINPGNVPLLGADDQPNRKQHCIDGDPTCDADGLINEQCVFRVAFCLLVENGFTPDCTATFPLFTGVEKFILQVPRPTSNNPTDASNALALLASFEALTETQPGGDSNSTFDFAPPLASPYPDNCTAPAEVFVVLGSQSTHSEEIRTRVFTDPPESIRDSDSVELVCDRAF
jgi:cysteine-rich repeat protein